MAKTQTSAGVSSIEMLAKGQRMVIYSIVLYLCTSMLWGATVVAADEIGTILGFLAYAAGLISLGLAFTGLLRLASGMGYSGLTTFGLLMLAFIPFVNVLVLLLINGRATRMLREAGYEVGLLGVRGTRTRRAAA